MFDPVDYIYSHSKFAKNADFSRISALLEALGNIQNKFKYVHIVGTNGKGSVSTMVSYVLAEEGYTVGLFTSPFVVSFLERIQINNLPIDEEIFFVSVKKVKEAADKLEQSGVTFTFFEVLFAASLLCFDAANCDMIVLEAGIGGEHDTTNVIPSPEVCAIASISLDHTQLLGNTVGEIVKEKCGIIKPGCFLACFPFQNGDFDFDPLPLEAKDEIEFAAKENGVVPVFSDIGEVKVYKRKNNIQSFVYKGINAKIQLIGDHQIANAMLAIDVLKLLNQRGIYVSISSIESGLSCAFLPCRLECLSYGGKIVILDGAHNPGSVQALLKSVEQYYPQKRIGVVAGFMKDKDYQSAIKALSKKCSWLCFSLADESRGAKLQDMKNCCILEENRICAVENNIDAFLSGISNKNIDLLVCAGSFYMVSRIRTFLFGGGVDKGQK